MNGVRIDDPLRKTIREHLRSHMGATGGGGEYSDIKLHALDNMMKERKALNETDVGMLARKNISIVNISDIMRDLESRPRISSRGQNPKLFNKKMFSVRMSLVSNMVKGRRSLYSTDVDDATVKLLESQALHEAAIQKHKNSLRRQMHRGQQMEGVQKLTVYFDVAAHHNSEEEMMLADQLMQRFCL